MQDIKIGFETLSDNEVQKVETRIGNQLNNDVSVVDVKVDLSNFLRQQNIAKHNKIEVEHHFRYEDIEEQDCLLLQVPNINESGYYSGIVGLKSYVDKFHSDLRVEIIDPVIDYFFLNPPDKQGEFFNMFNTYSKQGQFELLYKYPEITEIFNFIGKYIDKANPAFLGFSIIDGNIDASLALAKLVKEKYPHVKILLGGNGVEILDFGKLPNSNYVSHKYTFIDIISRGDGEMTFVELLKCDMSDDALMQIKGIAWRLNGVLIHNRTRENINMDLLPYPDYSALENNYYYKSVYQHNVPLVMSRGCPYRCSFCSVPDFVPEFRYRTVDNVIEEIEHWVNKGNTNFFCHDSIINGNPKWLKQFCEKIIEKGLNITWGGNMRLQTPMRDLDTMRLYRKAGLMKMITGFESASEPVLRHMKKYTNMNGVREIFENVRIVNSENEYPMQFAMQLIIGYLNEGEKDFQKTLDFIREYRDCMAEILTCSAFLIHEPLLRRWRDDEKEWIEYINGVNFSTKWNTPADRLKWLERCEELFIEIGIPYSIYNRGLYLELHEEQMKEKEATELLQRQLELNKQNKTFI
jgi:radical SAM superfamily enzyme YgiQ (UPF0313 family)